MTSEAITVLVSTVCKDFDFGKHDTNNLIRYFVYKYCCWTTQRSIAKEVKVHRQNVFESIKKVENDPHYTFIKLRIVHVINQKLDLIKKPVYNFEKPIK